MDDDVISMADRAGNKAPGVAKWVSTTPSYQELCSISGNGAPHNATAINTPPDRDHAQENRTLSLRTPKS
jgi:hypothetical protein